jgi:hypothetical protein
LKVLYRAAIGAQEPKVLMSQSGDGLHKSDQFSTPDLLLVASPWRTWRAQYHACSSASVRPWDGMVHCAACTCKHLALMVYMLRHQEAAIWIQEASADRYKTKPSAFSSLTLCTCVWLISYKTNTSRTSAIEVLCLTPALCEQEQNTGHRLGMHWEFCLPSTSPFWWFRCSSSWLRRHT